MSEDVLSKQLSDKSPRVTLCDYMGNSKEFPTERIYLKCRFFEGFTRAVIVPLKFCSVIVGNIPGVKDIEDPFENQEVSRSRYRQPEAPCQIFRNSDRELSPTEF